MSDREPVLCETKEVQIENDKGHKIRGVMLECTRCGHTTKSFGITYKSIKRCLALMREECPEDERNFYEADTDESE